MFCWKYKKRIRELESKNKNLIERLDYVIESRDAMSKYLQKIKKNPVIQRELIKGI